MNNTDITVPEGYKIDAKGDLIAIANIRPIDLAKDELVLEIVEKTKAKSAELTQFKARTMADVETFVQLSAEQYGVKLGGIKGNVSLVSFNGQYKIQRAMQETLTFDEKIQAAKVLIDECLREWTEGARPEVHTLINSAFDTDTEGNLNTGRILGLHRLKIDEERWQRAMQIIRESMLVQCSKAFIRVYEKNNSGEYQLINLDIAKV